MCARGSRRVKASGQLELHKMLHKKMECYSGFAALRLAISLARFFVLVRRACPPARAVTSQLTVVTSRQHPPI